MGGPGFGGMGGPGFGPGAPGFGPGPGPYMGRRR
jgi:spore coat protein D